MADEGLGNQPRSEWPRVGVPFGVKPIDMLKPKSDLHARVLKYLLQRLDMSERAMSRFYPRWQAAERRVQAYIDLPKWEQVLKTMNDSGKPPKVVDITVPYSYATLQTIVTYLAHTFMGRRPMFQVGSYKKSTVSNARMLELVLQYNVEHAGLVRQLFQFLQDGEMYGVAILRTRWLEQHAMRTVWKKQPKYGFFNLPLGSQMVRTKEERTVFAGNDVISIDPYMFFPDPRVPMVDVNQRGEFVFWRSFEGDHTLKLEEAAGRVKWINAIGGLPATRNTGVQSARDLISNGDAIPGYGIRNVGWNKFYKQIDQGSIDIIPRELGLGESTKVEKWIFAIGNRGQIIQAEPETNDHGMHPVAVAEPNTMGYGFGQPSTMDFMGPIQDTLSWLINSHIANVRTALNNMVIVDPDAIEVKDLMQPDAGKIIRLKRSAWGRDINSVIKQLAIEDVTSTHLRDFEMMMRLGDALSGVSDNLRGLPQAGGRKTATEARQSAEAGASRLAAKGRLISAQAITILTKQMSLNILQYMPEEFFVDVAGMDGLEDNFRKLGLNPGEGVNISPEMVVGDFYYPIHDGTLPMDRIALLDVWNQIFMAVAQDPQLRQTFNVVKIFEYIAELGGAKNLSQFTLNVKTAPDEQVAQQAQAGNLAPVGGNLSQPAQQTMAPAPTAGVEPTPRNRLLG